jgi:ParB family chromosome partitioning protein
MGPRGGFRVTGAEAGGGMQQRATRSEMTAVATAAAAAEAVPSDLLMPIPDERPGRGAPQPSEAEAAARKLRDEIAASPDFQATTAPAAPAAGRQAPRLERVPTLAIRPAAAMARQRLDAADLQRLAASIKGNGLAQPLLVRLLSEQPRTYELFAGYRRWRAALAAKIAYVPVIVFDGVREAVALELNLLENLNRRDLTIIEQAEAFWRLADAHGRTPEQIAALTGRSLNQVKNLLCLAALPSEAKATLRMGRIGFGHARALLGAADAAALARRIVAEGLTVRETEALAAQPPARAGRRAKPPKPPLDDTIAADSTPQKDRRLLQAELAVAVGVQFEIGTERERPALVIRGGTERDVDRAVSVLRGALKALRMDRAIGEASRQAGAGEDRRARTTKTAPSTGLARRRSLG